MTAQKIMQGDSYPIFAELTHDGTTLAPSMVADVEISMGEDLALKATEGRVGYDETMAQWYFVPEQSETLAMEPGVYDVIARVKYINGNVKGTHIGQLIVGDGQSTEVI